jgi:hypothetical protein
VTVGNNITVTGGIVPSSSFMRNRVINGDMRIDQRNNGAATTTTGAFGPDRWFFNNATDGTLSFQQSTDVPSGQGFTNSARLTATVGDASIGAAQYANIQYRIEGYNTSDFGFGAAGASNVTLSFWVKATTTGNYSVALYNGAENYINPQQFTVNATATWEKKTITYTGATAGTWLTTNGAGANITFYPSLGSNYLGAAGWNSSALFGVTGQSNAFASNSNIFAITGVQLEIGSVATPFERRLYGQELILCQRYYEMSIPQGTTTFNTLAGATLGLGGSTNDLTPMSMYKVTKRANPTIVPYSTSTGTANAVRDQIAGADVTSVSTEVGDAGFRVYKTSAFTVGRFYSWGWSANAEF